MFSFIFLILYFIILHFTMLYNFTPLHSILLYFINLHCITLYMYMFCFFIVFQNVSIYIHYHECFQLYITFLLAYFCTIYRIIPLSFAIKYVKLICFFILWNYMILLFSFVAFILVYYLVFYSYVFSYKDFFLFFFDLFISYA